MDSQSSVQQAKPTAKSASEEPENHQPSQRVLWFGSSENEFSWLTSHLAAWNTQVQFCGHHNSAQQHEWLEKMLSEPQEVPYQLVFACASRLDFDADWLSEMRASWPEISLAVACGQWWEGAGRTGIRQTPFVMIPWHRIWDGWKPWIDGRQPTQHDIVAASRFPWALPVTPDDTVGATIAGWRGLIVAADYSEWRGTEREMGCQVEVVDIRSLERQLTDPVDWLLFDESLANTFRARSQLQESGECSTANDALLARVQQCVRQVGGLLKPGAPVVVAATSPTWELCQQVRAGGATDVITKPTTGVAMRELLAFYASQSSC